MEIFIDSADLSEIKEAYSWGVIGGITTNPSLIKKAIEGKKLNMEAYIRQIIKVAKGTPVSLEVTTTNYKGMVKEGKNLFKKFHKFGNVYIKIPADPCLNKVCNNDLDGIKAISELTRNKIPVNCTLIFTPEQALLAAKAGAKIVSPFAGREDDFIREKYHIKFKKDDYFEGIKKYKKSDSGIVSGTDLIEKTVELFRKQKIKTKVLAASIRNSRQLREVAIAGADIATLPLSVLKNLIKHPKTMEGMKDFTKDAPKEYKMISMKKK